ncbi:glycosyltransferase family 9 protein [Luteirhabdus pelagi]|uniref:glycosyltransferase family 9 protein n=1 Tax=Luteirhabdus pelagi TaxID=2792783 RepID=UPI001939C569|nr:glycosyltransferase family 9 protein [Luteirhabdus pelagi]
MADYSHIAVIRLSAMGDVAMTVPVLRVLQETYPKLKLTVVSKKLFKPFFKDLPRTDFVEAEVYGKHKGFGLLSLGKELKSRNIQAVADLHNVIRSKLLSGYFMLNGITVETIDKGRTDKRALTQAQGADIQPLKTTHQRYADVFEALGLPIELDEHSFPARQPLTPRLKSLIGKEARKAIGIAPFAAFSGKEYPFFMMEEVVRKLNTSNEYIVFLFGGGEEEVKKLDTMAKGLENVQNMAHKLTFEEELALISNLDLMVAMDSGNGHLAAMYGIPVLTLWGVTHPYAGFVPFDQPEENQLLANRKKFPLIPTSVYGNKLPQGYEKAMETISVETVLSKIKELL